MRQRIAVAFALAVLCTACFQQKTAYTVLNGIASSVHAGMQSYGALVRADVVPAITQEKVKLAYESYQAVMAPAVMLAQAKAITPTSPEVVKVRSAAAALMTTLTVSGCPNCVLPPE